MTGYVIEIIFLQFEHFPLWIIYEINGIFLYNGIVFLHLGQNERGFIIDKLLGSL